MSKVKFYFNTKSLKYERVQLKLWDRLKRFLSYVASGLVFATVTIWIAYTYFDSPKEKQLKREIVQLRDQYDYLNEKMSQMNVVLEDIQNRDDNIYRVIFEAEPIPDNIRKAGFGGVDRYRQLEGYSNSDLLIETTKKFDQLAKRMYIQSKSFDDVANLAKNKAVLLASIPAIQPIANKDLRRMASGYGFRTHPIYKTEHFHSGIDFSANVGTEIYATGDGVVERADDLAQGYGNHVVINHGYGYETLYGHMSKIIARVGQRVKRGDIIGLVGSTGMSTAPHLHYEVIKNQNKINPINFFFNDLSADEYAQMLDLSSKSNQSFD
ncbi:MAG: M23 family metallopeptidase [Bacteroidetes bacterium]|nr:M23 family metallopeptidase [Bacteroidota bacterium]MBK9671474.1 M23 family metallopeptidase [Bacteroidota bacterium]MBK9799427.1 M23 family metallopeptidase [Bacteroidota bacterium]MBP6412147.1 M23 family metallopeptidase [Bacteroidia bacterium]